MAGVDLRTVQELMGHKTMAMTLRYSHLSADHQREAIERLNRSATGTTTGTSESTASAAEEDDAEATELSAEMSGPCRSRTYDPLIKSQLLYQLS